MALGFGAGKRYCLTALANQYLANRRGASINSSNPPEGTEPRTSKYTLKPAKSRQVRPKKVWSAGLARRREKMVSKIAKQERRQDRNICLPHFWGKKVIQAADKTVAINIRKSNLPKEGMMRGKKKRL